MTNLVQFPGLGLSFELNRVAFSIGGFSIYWYGVCIAFGICLALVFAFRHSIEFGVDPDTIMNVLFIYKRNVLGRTIITSQNLDIILLYLTSLFHNMFILVRNSIFEKSIPLCV